MRVRFDKSKDNRKLVKPEFNFYKNSKSLILILIGKIIFYLYFSKFNFYYFWKS